MSKVNFKPNEDRILVEAAAAEEKTASGIIIPDTAKEKPQEGLVVAVGAGTDDKPVTVKVGELNKPILFHNVIGRVVEDLADVLGDEADDETIDLSEEVSSDTPAVTLEDLA